jgi:hypothetical protein
MTGNVTAAVMAAANLVRLRIRVRMISLSGDLIE